jgi:hypothetical protein
VNRKYPVAIANRQGEILFVWTEATAWKRGGPVKWQVYDQDGVAESASGAADSMPAFSVVAAFAKPDGSFAIVY